MSPTGQKPFVCTQEEAVKKLQVDVAYIMGELGNGLNARVKLIEKMQWWQIGIMVTLIGFLITCALSGEL